MPPEYTVPGGSPIVLHYTAHDYTTQYTPDLTPIQAGAGHFAYVVSGVGYDPYSGSFDIAVS